MKAPPLPHFSNKRKACRLLAGLVLAAVFPFPAAAQQKWEFVPGSRQARPVSAQPAGAPTGGYGAVPGQPGTYYRPATRGGGMQLRQPSAASYPQQSYTPRQSAVPTVQTRPATPATSTVTTSGKGKSYDFTDNVTVDGVSRIYRAHIPACYDRTKATPVVLAFHGLGMNSVTMLGMSGFNGLSERKNFIVVYGEGINNRWSEGNGGPDDIGYVQAVLQKLARVANIDQRRIYACGISNGGFFTQRLACAMPDKIAAAGVVASSMMASSLNMAGGNRMPIVFFLGTEDPLLPWGDGRNKALGKLGESLGLSGIGSIDSPLARMGGLMSVPEVINFWTAHNGCGGSPSVQSMPNTNSRDNTTVKKETYGSGDVTLYVIEGGGHTWPGMIEVGAFSDLCGTTCQDIDASEIMWEFFQRHSR